VLNGPIAVGFALPRDLDPSRSTSTLFSVVMSMAIRFQIPGFRSRRSANPTTPHRQFTSCSWRSRRSRRLTAHHHHPTAFIILPLVSAFFIDIMPSPSASSSVIASLTTGRTDCNSLRARKLRWSFDVKETGVKHGHDDHREQARKSESEYNGPRKMDPQGAESCLALWLWQRA
jgi:hypothetical protein